jgi:hypothetical protein
MQVKHFAPWLISIGLALAATLWLTPDTALAQGPDTAEIDLASGWNLVSVPVTPDDGVLPAALGDAAGQVDRVRVYDASDPDDPWQVYDPALPAYANDLAAADETMGLWIHATEVVT